MPRIETYEDLVEFIRGCHNSVLAKKSGHVTQIWEDGEITSQNSGELLWMRGLHSLLGGIPNLRLPMPVSFRDGSHFYAYVSGEDAVYIARAIVRIVKRYNGTNAIDVDLADVQSYALGVERKAQLHAPRGAA